MAGNIKPRCRWWDSTPFARPEGLLMASDLRRSSSQVEADLETVNREEDRRLLGEEARTYRMVAEDFPTYFTIDFSHSTDCPARTNGDAACNCPAHRLGRKLAS
jgi:hypothetical protein